MSQPSQRVVQDAEEHRKEIVMCAYGPRGYNASIEQWVTDVTDIDCVKKETIVDDKYQATIHYDDGGFCQQSFTLNDHYMKNDELQGEDVLNELRNCDHIEVVYEVNKTREYVNKLSHANHEFLRKMFDQLPSSIQAGYELQPHRSGASRAGYYEVEEEDGDKSYGNRVINATPNGFDQRRVLKKEVDREPGAMYESIGKVPSFQFQLILKAPDNETMTAWTDEVIVQLHKHLSRCTGVKKVRYTSCEVTTTKEGECFI